MVAESGVLRRQHEEGGHKANRESHRGGRIKLGGECEFCALGAVKSVDVVRLVGGKRRRLGYDGTGGIIT